MPFILAFLPQFVDVGTAHPTAGVLFLGLAFAGLTFLIKGPVGLAAGYLIGWLRANAAGQCWLYRTSGAVRISFGVELALERRN